MKTNFFHTVMLLALCLAFKSSFSQNISWIRQQGGSPDLGIDNASATDAAGNIYVTGTTPDPAYFDDVTVNIGQPDNNVFVAKYSPSGEIIWAKSYGSHDNDVAYDIAADPAGNTYIVGHYNENITFGAFTLLDYDERDAFIVKSDPDGNVVWAHSIENTGPMHAFAVSLYDTSLYITGDISNEASYDGNVFFLGGVSAYLLKINTDGEFIWVKDCGTPYPFGFDLKNDADGNILMAGSFFYGYTVIGSIELTTSGMKNMFLAKITPDGNELWANTINNNTADESEGRAVALNDEGDVYVTGYFSGSLFLDTLELTAAEKDIFVAKYNSAGNPLWLKGAGGAENDDSYAIEKNAIGGVYVAGSCGALTDAHFDSITLAASDDKFMFVANYLPDGTVNTVYAYDKITPNHLLLINDSTFNLSAHLDSAIAGTIFDDVTLSYSDRDGLLMQFHDTGYQCKTPGGLYSDLISDVSATIHWDAVPNADAYILYYFPLPGDTLSLMTSSTDITLSDLIPTTNYAYYVRSLCAFSAGDTINGENSPLYTFSTTEVAVNNITDAKLQIYPNPNDGNFTIELPFADDYKVVISDMRERMVYTANTNAMKMQISGLHLSSGLYSLNIISDNLSISENIIIR